MNALAALRPAREVALDLANHAETIAETRAVRMAHSTFKVWRVTSGLSQPHPVVGGTLVEVERELAVEAHRGETFNILETLTIDNGSHLHTCVIRRGSKPTGWRDGRRVYAYTADRVCSVAVVAFQPRLPWRWSAGCDALGRSAIVEGARA